MQPGWAMATDERDQDKGQVQKREEHQKVCGRRCGRARGELGGASESVAHGCNAA